MLRGPYGGNRLNIIDLKGRVAVMTGGARGIGYAAAERMLISGATVVIWESTGRHSWCENRNLQPDEAGAYRFHARENSDEPISLCQ
jgi:NAD(P)-dependent dehydrogenase (short-subunit alcohol dehydrogenase family)